MALRQKVEEHPVFFVGGLMIASFVGGWTAHVALGAPGLSPAVTCTVQGLPDFSAGHSQRVTTLQSGLVQLEGNASDDTKVPSYQEGYQASADRVRKDIAAEQDAFARQLQLLRKACS